MSFIVKPPISNPYPYAHLRDEIAMEVMKSLIKDIGHIVIRDVVIKSMAKICYEIADAMLKERNKIYGTN